MRESDVGGAGRVRIVVDARGLHASGIGRYLSEVLSTLLADTRFSRVILLGRPEEMEEWETAGGGAGRVERVAYPFDFYSPAAHPAWMRLRARGLARGDVFFFPHYDAPLVGLPPRSVVTVHDLIHFKVPEAFARWRRAAASVLLGNAVRSAHRVITVSEAAKRDLVERFPAQASKVDVVLNGVSPFFRAADADRDAAATSIGKPYLLCVGNRKPHKNLIAGVEVLARTAAELPDLQLVVVGPRSPEWVRVLDRAEQLGARDRILDFEHVTDERLRALYLGAHALLFPSLYEGFGLPALEAMSCGTPVIASDRASIPEIVGDAGILSAPDDHAAMAEAVVRLWRQPALRRDLARRGEARAASFSWECSTRRTVEVLYRVGAGLPASPARP